MARINMTEVVEALDDNFKRVLTAVVAEISPGTEIDPKQIMQIFRMRLERGFEHWERVPDRCVDAEY